MKGEDKIKELKKAPLCHKDKANELIKRLNRDWFVDLPDSQFGTVEFNGSDTEVRLDMSQLNVVEIVACLADGTQVTLNVIGYQTNKGVPDA